MSEQTSEEKAIDEIFIHTLSDIGKSVVPSALEKVRETGTHDALVVAGILGVANGVADRFATLVLALQEDRVIIIPTEIR